MPGDPDCRKLDALAARGSRLSFDNRLSSVYIRTGKGDVETIADTVVGTEWLYANTDYPWRHAKVSLSKSTVLWYYFGVKLCGSD